MSEVGPGSTMLGMRPPWRAVAVVLIVLVTTVTRFHSSVDRITVVFAFQCYTNGSECVLGSVRRLVLSAILTLHDDAYGVEV